MAANLSVEVGLTGNAAQAAKQITDALKEMGKAGDTATRSVQQLQEAASKPIGAGISNAQAVAQMVAGFERARQVMQEMQVQAAGMASVGLGAEFAGVAAGAKEVSAALTEAIGIFRDMVREGASVEDILAAMKEQAMGLPEGFERLSAAERMAFQQMQADIEGSIGKYKEFQNAAASVAKDAAAAAKEFQANERDKQREIDQETAALKRQEQQLRQNQNIHRTATSEMSRSPLGGAVSTMMNISMGASMLGQGGLMGPVMGMQMLGTGLSEASAGATTFGASFLALMPILAAGAAALGTVAAAVKMMQEALKSAAEEQTLETRLKAVTGSASAASTEMENMKSFVTGGAGGFLQLQDVAAGTAALQNLIGPAAANRDIMEGIAGSAAKAGKGYQEVATQVGAVIAKMREGAPIRETGLIELQKEGILTADDVAQIGKMIKAHADASVAVNMLTARLHENASAATATTNTWKGLWQQLSNVVSIDVFAPMGEKLISAFSPAIKTLTSQLVGLGNDVVTGLETGNFAPAIENLVSTAFVDGWKTAVALIQAGIPALTTTFVSLFQKAFQSLVDPLKKAMTDAFDAVATHVGDDAYWTKLNHAIAKAIEDGAKSAFSAVLNLAQTWWKSITEGMPSQAELDALNKRFGVGPGQRTPSEVGPENVGVLNRPEELTKIDVTGQLGGAAKAQSATDQFKALDELIKQIGRDETLATHEISLYDAEVKAGMLTADQAAAAKDKAYQDEINNIQKVLPQLDQWKMKLEAMAAGYAAIGDTKNLEKVREEIDKVTNSQAELNIKMADTLALQQQLGTKDPFTNFVQGVRDATAAWGTFGQQTIQLGRQITDELASGMGNAMAQLVEGTGNLKQAFISMADSIIKAITDMIAKELIQLAVQQMLGIVGGAFSGATAGATAGASNAFFGSSAGATGGVTVAAPAISTGLGSGPSALSVRNSLAIGQQSGGLVSGPSGPDRVPSMLTSGEYVLTNRAVDKYGIAMIEAMNRGTYQKYASGGFVGSATSPNNIPPSQNANANSPQNIAIVTNVTVPGAAGTAPGGVSIGGGGSTGTGISPQDAAQLQQSISMLIRDEIIRQKRPGGLLSKQQFVGP